MPNDNKYFVYLEPIVPPVLDIAWRDGHLTLGWLDSWVNSVMAYNAALAMLPAEYALPDASDYDEESTTGDYVTMFYVCESHTEAVWVAKALDVVLPRATDADLMYNAAPYTHNAQAYDADGNLIYPLAGHFVP